jgi:chemotaxis protein CheC
MASDGSIKLDHLELDALREVGNVGAGRAATALSQMLGRPVCIDVPKASIVRLEDLPEPLGGPEKVVAATYFRVYGDAPGRLLVLIGDESLPHLLTLLMGQAPAAGQPLDVTTQSAVKELGNILCSAYLNALADFMGFPLLPSVPALAIDMVSAVLQTVASDAAETGSQALLIENRFRESSQAVPLFLFFLPEPGALQAMLAGLARATGTDPRPGRG